MSNSVQHPWPATAVAPAIKPERRTFFVVPTLIALLVSAMVTSNLSAAESQSRTFAAAALAFRASGVIGNDAAVAVLKRIPGGGPVDMLPELWRPFFENTIVKLGRLRSAKPVAFYYNPLLDVALFTVWVSDLEGYRVESVRAIAGERYMHKDAPVLQQPIWMAARGGSFQALQAIASQRLKSVSNAHPVDARETHEEDVVFAVAADDMRAVLPRMVWNLAMRTHWGSRDFAWLDTLLQEIDGALAFRNSGSIKTVAPETDVENARLFADLPLSFSENLVLDATLRLGDEQWLVVASSPGDGQVYVCALCKIDGATCVLRRLLLISLVD